MKKKRQPLKFPSYLSTKETSGPMGIPYVNVLVDFKNYLVTLGKSIVLLKNNVLNKLLELMQIITPNCVLTAEILKDEVEFSTGLKGIN